MTPLSPSLAARLSARSAIRSSQCIAQQSLSLCPTTQFLVSSPCNGQRHIHSNTPSNPRKNVFKSLGNFSQKVSPFICKGTNLCSLHSILPRRHSQKRWQILTNSSVSAKKQLKQKSKRHI